MLRRLPDIELSVSATTRPARPGEIDGQHYEFMDPSKFAELANSGGFLEWAEIFGYRYGTPRKPVDEALEAGRDVLLEIDVQGARQVRRTEPDAFMIFIKPPSLEELERRLRTRATESEEQIRRRLAKASSELAAEPEFDATVLNDDLECAVRDVIAVIQAHRGVPSEGAGRAGPAR